MHTYNLCMHFANHCPMIGWQLVKTKQKNKTETPQMLIFKASKQDFTTGWVTSWCLYHLHFLHTVYGVCSEFLSRQHVLCGHWLKPSKFIKTPFLTCDALKKCHKLDISQKPHKCLLSLKGIRWVKKIMVYWHTQLSITSVILSKYFKLQHSN